MSITYEPIGIVHSSYRDPVGVPIQGALAPESEGTLKIYPPFAAGLQDIEGFSHLIVIYHFHAASEKAPLLATPFLDDEPHGIFAIRSPRRPNPIGLSVVRLLQRRDRELRLSEVDMIDGTPVLDLKPFVPRFDHREGVRIGWFSGRLDRPARTHADDRFGGSPPEGRRNR